MRDLKIFSVSSMISSTAVESEDSPLNRQVVINRPCSIRRFPRELSPSSGGSIIRCYCLGTSSLLLNISEPYRHKTTISDAHNVNLTSTASTTAATRARAWNVSERTGAPRRWAPPRPLPGSGQGVTPCAGLAGTSRTCSIERKSRPRPGSR
jgi:hypothetical protein